MRHLGKSNYYQKTPQKASFFEDSWGFSLLFSFPLGQTAYSMGAEGGLLILDMSIGIPI